MVTGDKKGILLRYYPRTSIDRWLYAETGGVPVEAYTVPIGKAAVRRTGRDITLIGSSWMAVESLRAASLLEQEGIDAEVIDLRSLKPWDRETVAASVRKTGLAVVADSGWRTAGAAAEIAAELSELAFQELRAPIGRVTLPDVPAPTSREEEKAYYPGAADIAAAAWMALEWDAQRQTAVAPGAAGRSTSESIEPTVPGGSGPGRRAMRRAARGSSS